MDELKNELKNELKESETMVTSIRIPIKTNNRIDVVLEMTKPKYGSRTHFINVALEGLLKIQEEKIKTIKEGETNDIRKED